MTKYFISVVVIICVFLGLCCKDNGVAPEELKPGRRDYVWTVDTLRVPVDDYFSPSRIWGSAPNDIWLAGNGSPTTILLWHFDGESWKRDSTPKVINPSSLWGFTSNDIWLGNSGNVFWRYDGTHWYEFCDVTPPVNFQLTLISDIWGIKSNDVWGVGFAEQLGGGTDYKAIIMHFDGTQWQFMNIPDIKVGFHKIRQQSSSGLYFVFGVRNEPIGDTCKVYVYDGKNTVGLIYSNPYVMYIEEINGEIYFISQQKIYKYKNGTLVLWKDLSNTEYFGRMVGRSEIDFFGLGKKNNIVHYNGTDLAMLYQSMSNIILPFLVGDSAFFICQDSSNGVVTIIQGKLKSQ